MHWYTMVACVSHVFMKTVITILITCKIASIPNSTVAQVEDVYNITAQSKDKIRVKNKNMEVLGFASNPCPNASTPKLDFFVSPNGNPPRGQYAEIYYSNVWQEMDAIGVDFNLICGNETACCCDGNSMNLGVCWNRTKYIVNKNSTCPIGANNTCKERFDIAIGNCCVQMFVYCKESKPLNYLAFKSRTKQVLLQFQMPPNQMEIKEPENDSYRKRLHITIALSTLGVFLVIILISAFLYKYSRLRTSYRHDMDKASTEINNIMLKSISDSSISEQLSFITPETNCILIMFYPDDESKELFNKFLQDLATTLDCKIVTAMYSMDDIATNGVGEWAYQSIHNANKIIVFSSKQAFQNDQLRKQTENTFNNKQKDNLLHSTFLVQWTILINDQTLKYNYHKVFNVRFQRTETCDVLTDIVPGRHYVMPHNFHQLVAHLKF